MINNLIKRLGAGKSGSALIMTVVLTVLLAIIAVMFVAVARMDRASTSNIADNKSLDLAAKSITEIISKDITKDIPGMTGYDPNKYCTYPDNYHPWLACIEPYIVNGKSATDSSPGVCRWRQISDVTGYLKQKNFSFTDVNAAPIGLNTTDVVREYPVFDMNSQGVFIKIDKFGNRSVASNGISADADGDGIADSKWIEVNDLTWSIRSSKGQKIYAAIRVIDNSAMVNVNTAYNFFPTSADSTKIDGSDLMQINLNPFTHGLLKTGDSVGTLHQARCGTENITDYAKYERCVIWDYNSLSGGNYLPFDISDELELRYRFCINGLFKSRFEDKMLYTIKTYGNPGSLYDASTNWGLGDWQIRITEFNDVNDRRHLLTAYNLDRVIDPCGVKMTNINDANINTLYNKIRSVTDDGNAAQIAVNMIDYRDGDSNVTVFHNNNNGKDYYGFEQPCVYISELAYQSDGITNYYYAIELYNPYGDQIVSGNGWKLTSSGGWTINVNWTGTNPFYVILSQPGGLTVTGTPQSEPSLSFIDGDTISLTRTVDVRGTPTPIVVDSVIVPAGFVLPSAITNSIERDITPAKCIRRLWGPIGTIPSLGASNSYTFSETPSTYIQAHPKNGRFTNIGEIGMIFRKPAYYKPTDPCSNVIGYGTNKTEADVRLNLADPNYQKLFKYLTVMDPHNYISDANETRIKGRININTAPASVIAQLPWVSRRKLNYNNMALANAIVTYRDNTAKGFKNIGQLVNVTGMDYYSQGVMTGDQIGPPDLDEPAGDGASDDFEERDLIFARISDLVTVRSDIFTAYMLIRIGTDGPQKRYMVILDRSNVKSASDKVKIIAFQPVPQAR
jgi:hypothetical protein